MASEAALLKRFRRLVYRHIERKFLAGCSNFNSLQVRQRSRTKHQARTRFDELGVPHAKGRRFLLPFSALAFARSHGYPLVVKPNVSGFSRGSHFPIQNRRELLSACFKVKIWWPISIVEQYLSGHNYRVLVTREGIEAVIERYPPFVLGDGRCSVRELITRENATRDKMGLYPAMYPIPVTSALRRTLSLQHLGLDSVPPQGQRVMLHRKIALKPGGIVETLDPKSVHPSVAHHCKALLESFDANILGIDIIMRDGIEVDCNAQRCIFLEVNSRPYLDMHLNPRYGETPNLEPLLQRMRSLTVEQPDVF